MTVEKVLAAVAILPLSVVAGPPYTYSFERQLFGTRRFRARPERLVRPSSSPLLSTTTIPGWGHRFLLLAGAVRRPAAVVM